MFTSSPQPSQRTLTDNVRRPVVLGLFVGTTVGLGYLLAALPNVELMTLVTALAGVVLGARLGFLNGVLAMGIYSLGSPYGLPHPIMLAAQVLGMGLAGVIGHFFSAPVIKLVRTGNHRRAALLSLVAGLIPTFFFDLATNLASWLVFNLDFLVVLIGGAPLFLVHLGVNLVFFGLFFPLLAPRVAHLARSPISGRRGSASGALLLCFIVGLSASHSIAQPAVPDSSAFAPAIQPVGPDSTATTAPDTVAAAAPLQGAALAFGWDRPLWQPFAESTIDWLGWYSSQNVFRDGGVGAMIMVLGEGGTSPHPVFLRNGIPIGTGHLLADDPGLIPFQGMRLGQTGDRRQGLRNGWDGWGGNAGSISLWADDFEKSKAVSQYAGVKGPHETYMRSFVMRSPKAAWRFTFNFEEILDNGGYNYTDPDLNTIFTEESTRGHGKIRMGSGRISRIIDESNHLSLDYGTGRKTKNEIPVMGAESMEIWADDVALSMGAGGGTYEFQGSAFWSNRDVLWDSDVAVGSVADGVRKIETSREGLVLAIRRPSGLGIFHESELKLSLHHWHLADTGPSLAFSEQWRGPITGDGMGGQLTASGEIELGPAVLMLDGGGFYERHGGWMPGAMATLAGSPDDSWWEVSLTSDGRAPRSDELYTPQHRFFGSRTVTIYPNADLGRESSQRAAVRLSGHLLGLDLALDTSARRLTDGIMWQDDGSTSQSGYLDHGLEMTSTKVTAQVAREGRFLGWGRALLESTWQNFDESAGQAAFLPPEQSGRMELKWEHHYFKEDGILQLALMTWWRGEMADPWDVSRQTMLPAASQMDLIIGFRLVGAHLSVGLRNLADKKVQMTANSWSPGQEFQYRLNWTFLY